MEWAVTLGIYVVLRLAIWYMANNDPHPEIKLTEERRREILEKLAERRRKRGRE